MLAERLEITRSPAGFLTRDPAPAHFWPIRPRQKRSNYPSRPLIFSFFFLLVGLATVSAVKEPSSCSTPPPRPPPSLVPRFSFHDSNGNPLVSFQISSSLNAGSNRIERDFLYCSSLTSPLEEEPAGQINDKSTPPSTATPLAAPFEGGKVAVSAWLYKSGEESEWPAPGPAKSAPKLRLLPLSVSSSSFSSSIRQDESDREKPSSSPLSPILSLLLHPPSPASLLLAGGLSHLQRDQPLSGLHRPLGRLRSAFGRQSSSPPSLKIRSSSCLLPPLLSMKTFSYSTLLLSFRDLLPRSLFPRTPTPSMRMCC